MKINDKYIDELPDKYKIAYLEYMKGEFNVSIYGSHQPLLIHVMNTIIDGNVIEFGIGDNSTPILHLLCEKTGRKLFSYESDEKWYKEYKHYENDFHTILYFSLDKFYNNEYKFNSQKYSIAFIDSITKDSRQHAINLLKDSVDYFIIHDALEFVNGKFVTYNDFDLNYFKNVMYFKEVSRATVLCSNKEIPEEIKLIFTE